MKPCFCVIIIIMSKIYFITGVCGVGKSAIMPYLSLLLPKEEYDVRDFDERGVPENANRDWRISEAKHWIEEAEKNISKKMVVCGFVKYPDFQDEVNEKVVFILLDARPETIRQRLIKRYSKENVFDESQKVIGRPVNEFIESNVYILEQMRDMFKEKGCIIETSDLTPERVAKEVADIILKD